jgi:hypothetical protein
VSKSFNDNVRSAGEAATTAVGNATINVTVLHFVIVTSADITLAALIEFL